MRKRRPPFTLVLSTLVAAAAITIALADRGSSHPTGTGHPPTVGIGSSTACVTTAAEAQSDDRSAIVLNATASAPVRVSEQATGPNGVAIVTRSEVVTARIKADEPVEVKRTTDASARACARGESSTAARTTALRAAYARARAAAHALAVRQAAASLSRLIHGEYPTVLADAKSRAAARAHELAVQASITLAAKAAAEARQRAGT